MSGAVGKKGKAQESDEIIGNNIRLTRTACGLSQEALAEALGITFQQIQKYEKGKNRVSASALLKIAEFMSVHPMALLENAFHVKKGAPISAAPSAEALELLRVFNAIKDEKVRSSIKNFIKGMASEK